MNNSTETTPLFASNEVMSTFLSAHTQSNPSVVGDLKADPKVALSSLTACDVISVTPDINIVENSEETIHLMLPYYSISENIDAVSVADGDMNLAGGFEIIFSIIGAIVAGLGAIGGAIGIGSATSAAAIGSGIALGGSISAGITTAAVTLGGGGAAIAAGAVVVGSATAGVAGVAGTAIGVGVSEGQKSAGK